MLAIGLIAFAAVVVHGANKEIEKENRFAKIEAELRNKNRKPTTTTILHNGKLVTINKFSGPVVRQPKSDFVCEQPIVNITITPEDIKEYK